ncbi:MAG TPA: hypothetical protein VNL16_08655 [Chloroflexota bacterium]|nr:hypothetical protein [Chloroflexota bacterium]
MPDQQSRKNLVQDELVELLALDPAARNPEYHAISGWLGKSAHQGYWRLYPTPELDEYIEIAEDDILLQRPVSEATSPLGGSVLMIKATAELHSMGSTSVDARTAMLHGDITNDFSTKSGGDLIALMSGTTLGDKDYTKGFWCSVSMLFSCTTHVVDNWVCTLASGKLCGTRKFLP